MHTADVWLCENSWVAHTFTTKEITAILKEKITII